MSSFDFSTPPKSLCRKWRGNACPIRIGAVGFRAVRHAVTKEHDSARFQFDRYGAVFRGIASDVMIAKRISVVRVRFSVTARNHVQTSVFQRSRHESQSTYAVPRNGSEILK